MDHARGANRHRAVLAFMALDALAAQDAFFFQGCHRGGELFAFDRFTQDAVGFLNEALARDLGALCGATLQLGKPALDLNMP
jgi:hypothetical protein